MIKDSENDKKDLSIDNRLNDVTKMNAYSGSFDFLKEEPDLYKDYNFRKASE
ncbi:MAG TPA: hypothetical protein VI981_04015 [Candidatus Paceibacterota bacterium]